MNYHLTTIFFFIAVITYAQKDFTQYVNPFTGTQDMGHTFPGATVPFGMVQLSPDTDTMLFYENGKYNKDVYRYCAGYQYKDPTIVGFSHTHFNGTGHSDLGDFLIMPFVGKPQLNPGTADEPEKGYRSRFSHNKEAAEPGYYSVYLEDANVKAELTATPRTGIHQYTYDARESRKIVLDLFHGIYNYDGKVIWSSLEIISDTMVVGYRQTQGWARDRKVYFAMVFSEKIMDFRLVNEKPEKYQGFWRKFDGVERLKAISGKKLKAWFQFKPSLKTVHADPDLMRKGPEPIPEIGAPLKIKMALSSVSTEGAIKNLRKEAPHWDFDKYKIAAKEAWNNELSKIEIKAEQDIMENFYTAIYHTLMHPVVYEDVDKNYRGLDQNIYQSKEFTNYTIFSLWDTFRALHPLLTMLQPKRTSDMVNSMLAHQEQNPFGLLPIWSHYSNDNWCMTGYHAVSVIADAIAKDIEGIDIERAVSAMKSTLYYPHYDKNMYYKIDGYMPHDKTPNAASKTLEICYNDWSAYITANKTDNEKLTRALRVRADNYKNIFDPETGFMRSKNHDKSWHEPFDPLSTYGQGYIEGNAYTYSLFVPHDISGLTHIMGGDEKLINHLDTLFTMELPSESYAHSEDIEANGIIGNYIHGNEPGHHVPYMYNYVGQPWKTQEIVRKINKEMYKATPDGLCGNDDCGQMSAWYIFSALGFYPVTPGTDQYVLGSPNIENGKIHLDNGKTFEIEVKNQSPENIYV
jgi:predicted alpha-1,2-mannosidase